MTTSNLEPLFSIHIYVEGRKDPVMYYGMPLTDALDILKKWCAEWILIPNLGSYLDGIWIFHARPRSDNGMSFPEFKESVIQELSDQTKGE